MSNPKYQLDIGSEYKTGYVKTLINYEEFIKDLEKMEFLSRVLTNPELVFYTTTSPDTAEDDHLNYNIGMEKQNK